MIKNRQIKAAVIGVGQMGVHHARIYSRMAGVDLVGISDIDEERGNWVASRFNTKYFKDAETLLKKKPDAVTIAVPTSLHREIADMALDYNANLLVEKPLADNTKNAWAIIKKAKSEKRVLMVGHIERFNPAIESLKNLLALGTMGKIKKISTLRVSPVNGEDSIYTLDVTSSAVKSYKENKQIKLGNKTTNNTYKSPVLAMI